MSLSVYPLVADVEKGKFDLFAVLVRILERNKFTLMNGDIIVISSKYISNSQGRLIEVNKVKPSIQSRSLSKKFHLRPEIAEIILRESDIVFGGIAGFIITSSDNIVAPNAGIDKSNAKRGLVILYPQDPYNIAELLRRKIFLKFLIHVGIIIVDSRLMPARVGTTGVAIACSGLEPVLDMRAQKDLDGNPLKVTFQAVADNLASIANYKMGEGSESRPVSVIRDSGALLTDRKIRNTETAISSDLCVYMRGLRR